LPVFSCYLQAASQTCGHLPSSILDVCSRRPRLVSASPYAESAVAGVTGAARKQTERPSIVHTSLYLPELVYEALRKIAFEERLKIHDVVLEGIDLALRRHRYPSIEDLKAGKKR